MRFLIWETNIACIGAKKKLRSGETLITISQSKKDNIFITISLGK